MGRCSRQFPNRLLIHRKISGLTQKEVARELGVVQSRISAWENGEILPSLINLLKLSILYKTLINELYFELLKEYQREFDRRKLKGSDIKKKYS